MGAALLQGVHRGFGSGYLLFVTTLRTHQGASLSLPRVHSADRIMRPTTRSTGNKAAINALSSAASATKAAKDASSGHA